jgi:hypothetical protein
MKKNLVLIEGRPPVRFIAKQPNIIRNSLIRELFVNTNSISVFLPKRIIRSNTQKKEREKEVKKLSKKLNNQNFRNIEVFINDKRIEYFPDEKLIIKRGRSFGHSR